MTIREITAVLSETINEIHNAGDDKKKIGAVIAKADAEAAVAKQYFKGMEIVLRADEMSGRTDRIDNLIG